MASPNGRYTGRVVLVTGAAQGLGLAMTARFASEGAVVHACDLPTADFAALRQLSGEVHPEVVDVRSTAGVESWVGAVAERNHRIDVLVNNAGVIRDGRAENISDEDWATVVDVSMTGSFRCIRAVVPHMKAGGYGRIVSFSSMSWRGNFGQANYAAAKAGIVGMTRVVALEGARHGITANAIAPGLIDTPMLASMDASGRSKLAARVPLGAIGRPEDIAEAAAFLCSEAAGYVTGVVLDVDGGISIGSSLR